MEPEIEERRREYERGFRRAGLPLFIENYSATEDIFTRALPFLTLVFLITVAGAINLEWSFWGNVAAFVGGVAVLLGAYGVLNVLRGRPFRSVPRKVGVPELSAFVLLPAVLPLLFGAQFLSAAVTVAQQLVILGLTYLVVGFGLPSILAWAAVRVFRQLGVSLRLLTKAVPLLLVFSLVIFLTADTWQVFGRIPRPFLVVLLSLLLGIGSLFLLGRLPREVNALQRETDPAGRPLRRGQRFNVALVLFVGQALQLLVVSAGVGAFFVVFGALAVSPAVLEGWIGSGGNALLTFELLGHPIVITEELLRVSGAIAAFSGLYYAIAMLTDASYREEFLEAVTADMRQTFADRAAYLRLLDASVREHDEQGMSRPRRRITSDRRRALGRRREP